MISIILTNPGTEQDDEYAKLFLDNVFFWSNALVDK